MESGIFTLSGLVDDKNQTLLKTDLNPSIYMDPSRQHLLGLIGIFPI